MSGDINFSISIPCDSDGYILLKCNHCGTLFKITANDYNDDSVLQLHCPFCGLKDGNFLTDDVFELANNMIENRAVDLVFDVFKSMEKANDGSAIKLKAGKRPEQKDEMPIRTGVDVLEIKEFDCCKRKAKINPLLKITGCYCPFCGVRDYGVE